MRIRRHFLYTESFIPWKKNENAHAPGAPSARQQETGATRVTLSAPWPPFRQGRSLEQPPACEGWGDRAVIAANGTRHATGGASGLPIGQSNLGFGMRSSVSSRAQRGDTPLCGRGKKADM